MHFWNIVSARNLKRHCLDVRVMKGFQINLLWSGINYLPLLPAPFHSFSRCAFTFSGIQDGGNSYNM